MIPFVAGAAVHVARFVLGRTTFSRIIQLLNELQKDLRLLGGPNHRVRLVIKHNINDSIRWVKDHQRQIDYAAAVALTRTARRLIPLLEREVVATFDKPTNFSIKAFGSTMATRQTLRASVFIKDRQAKYLWPNIVGGPRQQKGFERRLAGEAKADGYWAPGEGVKLNAYGNISRAQITAIASKLRQTGKYGEVFVGVPRGHQGAPFGIWGRPKGGRQKSAKTLTPLLIFIRTPNYRKRFDYRGVVERNAQRIFDEEFNKSVRDAFRTIRPIQMPR